MLAVQVIDESSPGKIHEVILVLKCLQQATTPVNRKEGWFGIRQENLFWQKWYVER